MLYAYYDIAYKDHFKTFFRGTYIHQNPTENKNKYMIMYFNFSVVKKTRDSIQNDFNDYCKTVILYFLEKYKEYFPQKLIDDISSLKEANKMLYHLSSARGSI